MIITEEIKISQRARILDADAGRLFMWVTLSVTSVVPLLAVEFPPLYDFFHWVFQGHITRNLLFGGQDAASMSSLYSLSGTPVPDSIAPIGIAVLNIWLPALIAGQVFLALAVLFFAYSFAFMVRSIQQRPTVIEFLGFPWALGYFMYKGYNSYFVSLAVAFLAIGILHRSTAQGTRVPGRTKLIGLTLLGVALFLCHLLGWAVFAVGVGVYTFWLLRQRQGKGSLLLLATLVPAIVMLAIYTIEQRGQSGGFKLLLYDALSDKILSLAKPLMLFIRLDPFTPVFPLFLLNVVGLLLLAIIALMAIDLKPHLTKRDFLASLSLPMLFLGVLLLVVSLVMPFVTVGDLVYPDGRFILPGVLIALAALPLKKFDFRAGALMACVILLIMEFHLVEYQQIDKSLDEIEDATAATISQNVPVLTLTMNDDDVHGGCQSTHAGLSVGTPTLKWFGLGLLMDNDSRPLRANIMETSLVRTNFSPTGPLDLNVLVMSPDEVRAQPPLGQRFAAQYPYVQAFGCKDDLGTVAEALLPEYTSVTQGEGFAILRRVP